jgi:serine O-acetyltransferase
VASIDEVDLVRCCKLLIRHPALRAMAWFRLGSAAHQLGIRGIPSIVQRRLLRLYGLELAPGAKVGGGLYIAHPVGCVLHAAAIGDDVTVIGSATFGTRNNSTWPVIESEAFIGVGARVLGDITVGRRARVGANAVVLDAVPDGATVVGAPARVVRSHDA